MKFGPRTKSASATRSDQDFIRAVYQEHGRAVLAYATRLTGSAVAAEDVLQETLIRAWRHADTLATDTRSVRAWLFVVARNIVTDRARARAARPVEVTQQPYAPPVQHDHANDVVEMVSMLDALDALASHHRDVLIEVYYRGRTLSEAAAILGIPEGTARSRAFHALRTLRARTRPALDERKLVL
jgi:RNA polymerase sigma-70 factor (ECF subfamily)